MSRSPEGPDPDLLFDLPLNPSADDAPSPAKAAGQGRGDAGDDQASLTFPSQEEEPEELPPSPTEAPLAARSIAAALDLVVVVAVGGLALVFLRLLEVPIGRGVLAPLVLFLLSFSFLYQVMPLAFWGHTPGMAYAGIQSRAKNEDFMTIQQCILRWLGWLLTLATGGLAALLTLSGVSPSDLVSRTRTYLRRPLEP